MPNKVDNVRTETHPLPNIGVPHPLQFMGRRSVVELLNSEGAVLSTTSRREGLDGRPLAGGRGCTDAH